MEKESNKFHPQKGTASFNPLLEIPDTTGVEAFEMAKTIASTIGGKEASFLALLLYVRFSKKIPQKDKNLAKVLDISKTGFYFDTVSAVGCIHDNGQEWYEMNALIITLLNP